MRKLSAHYLYLGNGNILEKGVVTCDDDGRIVDIQDTNGSLKESANVEFYSGILIPGMVNTHCHLELSDTKGVIPQHTTLPDFIRHVISIERAPLENRVQRAKVFDRVMFNEGVSVVGDISNGSDSFEVKKESQIKYHTFVEALGSSESVAKAAFQNVKEVLCKAHTMGLSASIVPHAPYSVSSSLMEMIDQHCKDSVISIHNQESSSENELFLTGTGAMAKHLSEVIGLDMRRFNVIHKSSIHSYLDKIATSHPLLLVHNTFMRQDDIELVRSVRGWDRTFLALCLKSNLYIENQLPDLSLFLSQNIPLTIGTDSLASNTSLSMIEEMKVLQDNCDELSLNDIIEMATLNGAKALQLDHQYGSIEVGKSPGIVLLKDVDLKKCKLTANSRSERII